MHATIFSFIKTTINHNNASFYQSNLLLIKSKVKPVSVLRLWLWVQSVDLAALQIYKQQAVTLKQTPLIITRTGAISRAMMKTGLFNCHNLFTKLLK